jgi:hypothetical protein
VNRARNVRYVTHGAVNSKKSAAVVEALVAPPRVGLGAPAAATSPPTRLEQFGSPFRVVVSDGLKWPFQLVETSIVLSWWAFLDTYRTACIAPSREIRETFEQIRMGTVISTAV